MVLNQNELYYQRMAGTVGDKSRILEYVVGSEILEIGFGGGELLDILHDKSLTVYGIDASEVSVDKVSDKSYADNIRVAYANEISQHWENESFDTIMLSSVLHEVFSYGNRLERGKHSISSLSDTFSECFKALKPGGRIVIRDGVKAQNWDDKVQLVMLNNDIQGVYDYLDLQPFKELVSLTQTDNDTFLGNMESVEAFAYTYTWGKGSLERESQELFGVLTSEEYAYLLESHGFKMLYQTEYVQQGYIKHLSPQLRFQDQEGNELPFPSTNAIWVAEKPM